MLCVSESCTCTCKKGMMYLYHKSYSHPGTDSNVATLLSPLQARYSCNLTNNSHYQEKEDSDVLFLSHMCVTSNHVGPSITTHFSSPYPPSSVLVDKWQTRKILWNASNVEGKKRHLHKVLLILGNYVFYYVIRNNWTRLLFHARFIVIVLHTWK